MPGGDGTGPSGLGPMTGRAAGYCAGYSVPGYANFGTGAVYRRRPALAPRTRPDYYYDDEYGRFPAFVRRGRGRGRGRGAGRGRWF